jgi:hypothetical protein
MTGASAASVPAPARTYRRALTIVRVALLVALLALAADAVIWAREYKPPTGPGRESSGPIPSVA